MIASTKSAILIIEHDDATRELYTRELRQVYEVFAYADNRGVLDLLQTQSLSALVIEPSLPDGSGWALLAQLKQSYHAAHIPIIICSTDDRRKRGVSLGAAAYLIKPVLPISLRQALQRVIEQAEQERHE